MSEPITYQRQLMLGLAVVAVLLAVIAGLLIWQNNRGPVQPDLASAGQPAATPTGQTPAAQTPAAEFDPATAPKVPADQEPKAYVEQYYKLSLAGDYDTAFAMLPTAVQASYGDAASFGEQLAGYGISGYSVDEPTEEGGELSVVGYQEVQGMNFGYTWTFAKSDDGSWLVKSRQMAGMN